jgi:alkylhydroperoxidase/carboxymuconolactone decarboxylase family protein YurZ
MVLLPKKQKNTYTDFQNSVRYNEILKPNTTLMIHMAVAMANGCYPLMKHYLEVAREEGLTPEEIGAVQSIVMAVSAGSVRAQFREVCDPSENPVHQWE